MSGALTWLGLLLFAGQRIALPEEIDSVGDLARAATGLAIVDTIAEKLWLLGDDGRIAALYERKGNGPGELRKLLKVRWFDGKFFLPDMMKRSVIVLDSRFQFLRELKVDGMCRDVLWFKDHYYFVYWDAQSGSMVHRYTPSLEKRGSFGRALDHPRLLGFQSGQLLIHGDLILFVHNFIPAIQVFDQAGTLLHEAWLPGFEEPFISLASLISGKRFFRYVIQDFFAVVDGVFLKLNDQERGLSWTYLYQPEQNVFSKKVPCPWNTVSDRSENLYRVHLDRDGYAVALEKISSEDQP